MKRFWSKMTRKPRPTHTATCSRPKRLELEALEDRLVMSWTGVPPATITPPTNAVAVTLDSQGDATGTASIANNEEDYYTFVAAAAGSYRFTAAARSSTIDTVLGIFNAQGQRLAYNDDIALGSNTDSLVTVNLQAGARYYFGITNYTGTPGGGYAWGVDGPAGGNGGTDDSYEENDSQAQAANLGTLTQRRTLTGLVMADSADWFRFTLATPGTKAHTVTIQFQHAQGDLDLRLYKSDGTLVRLSDGVGNEERLSLDGLAADTYSIRVYGYQGAKNASYTLDLNPGASSPPPGGARVLYLNFDGATISRADLVRWAGTDWAAQVNQLDPRGDGIRVPAFLAGRSDREQVISRLMAYLQADLQPFGITLQRHRGLAVENQGVSTVFLGANDVYDDGRGSAHRACEVDFGNNNRTDIAFVGDENWGSLERTALALADVTLHEAGHTYGLHHVNTRQSGQLYPESMGLRYTTSTQSEWVQNTSFMDRTFVAYVDSTGHPHGPGPQNSYQALRRNLGVGGSLSGAPSALIDTSAWGTFRVSTGAGVDTIAVRRLASGAVEMTINGSAYELGAGLREIHIHTQGDRRDRIEVQGDLGDIRLRITAEQADAIFGAGKVDPRLAAYWNGSRLGSDSDHEGGCGGALGRWTGGEMQDFSGAQDWVGLGTPVAEHRIQNPEEFRPLVGAIDAERADTPLGLAERDRAALIDARGAGAASVSQVRQARSDKRSVDSAFSGDGWDFRDTIVAEPGFRPV
jgi:hypothetical protein